MADSKIKLKVQQITSFNSGEFSPQMSGRVDLDAFGSSARKISNFLAEVAGGLKKFYGTYHVADITKTDEFKLVPFINKHEPMVLVLHGESIGLIYSDRYRELSINTPAGLNLNLLRWRQINDRILFVHPNISPFSIDFYGPSDDGYDFRISYIEFEEVPYFPIGWTGEWSDTLVANTYFPNASTNNLVTLSIPDGGMNVSLGLPEPMSSYSTYTNWSIGANGTVTVPELQYTLATASLYRVREGVTTMLATGTVGEYSAVIRRPSTSGGTLRPGVGSVTDQLGPTITVISGWTATETITREKILNVVKTVFPGATYSGDTIKISVSEHEQIQAGDNLYIELNRHPVYNPNTGVTTGEEVTTVSEQSEITGKYFESDTIVGRKIKIYSNADAVSYPWYAEEAVESGVIRYSNGSWYIAVNGGTCGKQQPSHLKGVASDGGVNWRYLHSGSVTGSVTGMNISRNQIYVRIPNGAYMPVISSTADLTFNTFAWSIWGTDNIHPSDIYFTQNRLGLICNTKNFGSWNAMSVSDKLFDFSTEQYGQQLDTSAIVHVITNNPDNKINWVLSYNSLYMGSDTNEFNVSAANDVFTPTSLICNPVSSLGGAAVVPLKYKELNLFVGSSRDELYSIGYDYTIDDYVPKSIGYITNHLLSQGISRLISVNNKDQNVYILHDTGRLSVLNYVGEQSVLGYSEIEANEPIIDMCATSSGADRASYMAVERREGYISLERVADYNPVYMWNTHTGLSSDDISSVTAPALAGKDVYVVVDGQFVKTVMPEDGVYTFAQPVNNYMIGEVMVSELHTQPAFGRKMEGLAQQSVKVSVRLYESGAFSYGDSTDFTKYHRFNKWGTDEEWSTAHNLYTGDALLDLASGHTKMANEGKGPYPNDTGIGSNIRAETPQPFTILSIQEVYV